MLFQVNGKKTKLHGYNRHDLYPQVTGPHKSITSQPCLKVAPKIVL